MVTTRLQSKKSAIEPVAEETSDLEAIESHQEQESSPEPTDLSLDQLLQELAKETQAEHKKDEAEGSSFDSIERELKALPKLASGLESQPEQPHGRSKSAVVVNINDPVHIVRKPSKKAEPTDAGDKWFNMSKPEMTPELKRDLLILKNRSVLDPKRHYKKEKWNIPKFFQTGTIVEGNTEFYSARLAKKNRGKTFAEEILNDDQANQYFKRKYDELTKDFTSGGKKHYKKLMAKKRGY